MDLIRSLFEFFLHIDKHLSSVISTYGAWTYALLFFVIFLETGVVITPFLPGNSLLFAAGSFAALGALNVWILFLLLCGAAILGDSLNYWIGHRLGPRVFRQEMRFMKREYLDRTHAFYEKHGGKTIFLARFIPIIRTFAPFVAGIGAMTYPQFLIYNIVGGIVWTAIFVFGGFFFGNLPFVRDHFTLVIIAIILISLLPIAYEFLAHRTRRSGEASKTPAS